MTAHCMLIGLDGADPRILFRAMDQGKLPNLAKLAARGRRQLLRNAGEYSDDSVWASFCFGKPPQQHGRHHYRMQLSNGKYGMAFTEESARDTFWWKLSDAGAAVAIVDIPKCPPPIPFNGVQLADWLVHGKYRREPVSYPSELAGQIISSHGASPPSKCSYLQEVSSDAELLDFHEHLQSSIQMKHAAGLDLINRRHWDVFAIAFKEAHCAGHHLWHLSERHHMHPSQPVNNRLGDLMMSVYVSLDTAVGEFIEAAGDSCNVIVFTSSAMTSNGSLKHLEKQLEKKLTDALVHKFGGWISRSSHRVGLSSLWLQRTRCMMLPCNDNLLSFKILTDRDVDHDDAVDLIEHLLRSLRDPITQLPPFTMLSRPAQNDVRPWADLVLHCTPGYTPEKLVSPALKTITAASGAIRTGNHVGGGAYIASGQQVGVDTCNIEYIHELARAAESTFRKPSPDIVEEELIA